MQFFAQGTRTVVRERTEMPMKSPVSAAALLIVVLAAGACATPATENNFNTFLQTIAADCKPLIIGGDNMGQAIVFNGLGAQPEHYNSFVAKTQALYSGAISPQIYRDSLTAFVGAGTSNQRSFDCIESHLPTKAGAGAPK
jgi:hypothetical protein